VETPRAARTPPRRFQPHPQHCPPRHTGHKTTFVFQVRLVRDQQRRHRLDQGRTKCEQSKVHRHIHVKPLPIPIPQRKFAHIHIDLVGPLTISLGHSHILTIIDRTSRWMEAIPLTNTDVAAALFSGWISRFGVRDTITSDRGPQFTSNIWNSLCLLLQIKHRPTSTYHPQAKGMVERLHRRLKDALRTRGANATWVAELPWVLLGLRSQPREDSNISPA
jgi:transposase InsO family protein